jgi:hypothetical protein
MNPAVLATLRDIHLPPEPGAWPLGPGWWIVGAGLIAGLMLLSRYRRRKPLRQALQAVGHLAATHETDRDTVALARGITAALRQYANARFPEAGTQAMPPDAWLAFLESKSGANAFSTGPARVLATLPYQREATIDAPALIEATRNWLNRNHP